MNHSFSQFEELMANQQNFGDCVAQHLPYLNRIVFGMMRGNEMAEDIVQQTVLKALTHAHQFRFESTLKTWLGSIAINEVYQVFRSKWRTSAVPLIPEAVDAGRFDPFEFPNNIYEARERDLLVRRAVSCLPPPYRSVLELCDLQCLPLDQAARKLGLTLAAAKARRHRARKKLRPLVAELLKCRDSFPGHGGDGCERWFQPRHS
jgi:RNA polymerase sigma-70 factor (ECF subfamily)